MALWLAIHRIFLERIVRSTEDLVAGLESQCAQIL
jgi:hypothetical protein